MWQPDFWIDRSRSSRESIGQCLTLRGHGGHVRPFTGHRRQAVLRQRMERGAGWRWRVICQLFQQTTHGPHFQCKPAVARGRAVHGQARGRTKITQLGLAVHGIDQDVVRIQVTMHHTTLVQVRHCMGDITSDVQCQRCRQAQAARVHIARAALQAGWPRQVDVPRRDQRHQQTLGLFRVAHQPGDGCGQARMFTRRQASGQFVFGQAIAGHFTLEQLERQRLRPVRCLYAVDETRSALAQQGALCERVPRYSW